MRYCRVTVRFTGSKTPYFIGSQVRGALGYALKRVVCINPSMVCEECFAADNCLYYDWYEKKGGHHSYRLDMELGKPFYNFSVFLFEESVDKSTYVISALMKMLTENGLGVERFKPRNFEIILNGVSIFSGEKIIMPKRVALEYEQENILPGSKKIKIEFVTPLRIKHKNRFVRKIEDFHFPTLINSIYQREAQLLGCKDVKRLPFRVEGKIVDSFGRFKDLTRFSSRQKGKLKIGGLLGEIIVEGVDSNSYRLLKLSELIGAGKQTVFGLGKVKVVNLDTI